MTDTDYVILTGLRRDFDDSCMHTKYVSAQSAINQDICRNIILLTTLRPGKPISSHKHYCCQSVSLIREDITAFYIILPLYWLSTNKHRRHYLQSRILA